MTSATTMTVTLSLHDALPISAGRGDLSRSRGRRVPRMAVVAGPPRLHRRPAGGARRVALLRVAAGARRPGPLRTGSRSEEHTSELQSLRHLVCRLLLEKKKYY